MQVCQKPHSADGEQWCALSIWPGLGPSRIRSKHWQHLQMILANTLSITVFKPDDCTLDCFIDLWYVLLEFDTINSVQVERLAFGKRNLFPSTMYYVISKFWRSFSSPDHSLARIWLNLCAHICLPTFAAARQAGRARLINHEKNKHIATQIPLRFVTTRKNTEIALSEESINILQPLAPFYITLACTYESGAANPRAMNIRENIILQ